MAADGNKHLSFSEQKFNDLFDREQTHGDGKLTRAEAHEFLNHFIIHSSGGVDVDEDLASYWESLKGLDQKIRYTNEAYMRQVLGLKTLTDSAFKEDLRTSKRAKKFISGVPDYDILSNPQYCQDFQFHTIDHRDDKEDFILSDSITKVLYVADHYQVQTDEERQAKLFKRNQKTSISDKYDLPMGINNDEIVGEVLTQINQNV